jgi:hypothetical protein
MTAPVNLPAIGNKVVGLCGQADDWLDRKSLGDISHFPSNLVQYRLLSSEEGSRRINTQS